MPKLILQICLIVCISFLVFINYPTSKFNTRQWATLLVQPPSQNSGYTHELLVVLIEDAQAKKQVVDKDIKKYGSTS